MHHGRGGAAQLRGIAEQRLYATDADVARLSPLRRANLNVLGRYSFRSTTPAGGSLRPCPAGELTNDDVAKADLVHRHHAMGTFALGDDKAARISVTRPTNRSSVRADGRRCLSATLMMILESLNGHEGGECRARRRRPAGRDNATRFCPRAGARRP